jgi:DNA topoisomerase-1
MTPQTTDELTDLYEDTKACAQLIGLHYVDTDTPGITREKHGKGFTYRDDTEKTVDQKMRKRISRLVIPPAWHDVWIYPSSNGHILATGIDEKGRKQYIYHDKWRTMRDLIKFYRLIIFARALPSIRKAVTAGLAERRLTRTKVLAVMLWLLDNTYLRVGNEAYFLENESVGLTTLSPKNLVIAGSVITLSFTGKSGQPHHITFEDETIARILSALAKRKGPRLFQYSENGHMHAIEAADVNSYLQEITGVSISAKDFRTWGGTLMAFNHMVETEKKPPSKTPKPEKVAVEAADAAANVLGNTRSIARSSYVHPDILEVYAHKDFRRYYAKAKQASVARGLDSRESELNAVLRQLFDEEFDLLKKRGS